MVYRQKKLHRHVSNKILSVGPGIGRNELSDEMRTMDESISDKLDTVTFSDSDLSAAW